MEIIIILILILFNGMCSMTEIALVSSKRFKLENLMKRGNKGAKVALQLLDNPSKFLSTVQIGITLIGILTGVFGGESLTLQLNTFLSSITIFADYSHYISVFVVIFMITFFSIVFGELIPKKIGLLFPENIACIFSRPMNFLSIVAKPFVWLLTRTNDLFMKLVGIKDKSDSVSEEEIKAIVQSSANDGEIQRIEHNIVERVFALGDRRASELMTHRSDIIWIDINSSMSEIKERVKEEMHSIYPVANGSLDELIGIINIKLLFTNDDGNFDIKKYITKPIFVHNNTPAYKILENFRSEGSHLAIVVDEYGGVSGIITLDDVLDALVGDMSEKHYTEYKIDVRSEDSWLADAQYPYFEMLRYFSLSEEDNKNEYDTIAGLILDVMGHIPKVSDYIEWNGYKIEVVDMDGMRIDKLLIIKM